MSWLHAVILGLIQGCTEFFPISSSTHLKLAKIWLQLPTGGEEGVVFDLACHLGTLIALIVYFRKDLQNICWIQPRKMVLYLLALVPLIPAYFFLKPVRTWALQSHWMGFCLLITALMLFTARRFSKEDPHPARWQDALWIGTLQSIALVPGISRSASTITTGIHRGLAASEAVRFSFILSIPAIIGGALLEAVKLSKQSSISFDPVLCTIGFGVSAVIGMIVIRSAIPYLERGFFQPFAWYCLIMSVLLTLFL